MQLFFVLCKNLIIFILSIIYFILLYYFFSVNTVKEQFSITYWIVHSVTDLPNTHFFAPVFLLYSLYCESSLLRYFDISLFVAFTASAPYSSDGSWSDFLRTTNRDGSASNIYM